MKVRKTSKLFTSLGLMGMIMPVMLAKAQQEGGGLNAGEVNVVQEYRPTLADAVRIYTNPEITDSTPAIVPQQYTILPKTYLTDFKPEPLAAAKMKGEPLEKLYKGYAKVGAGNYWNTLAELYLNSLRSKKYSYGLLARHFSSSGKLKNYGYQGFSDNLLEGYGNFFIPDYTLKFDASFLNKSVHYYGFDDDYSRNAPVYSKSANRQIYNQVNIKTALGSSKDPVKGFIPDIYMGYGYFGDKLNNFEQQFSFGRMLGKYVDREFYALRAEAEIYNHTGTPYGRNAAIIHINPFMKATGSRWNARLGIHVLVQTDDKKSFFLPDVSASYSLIENILSVYGSAESHAERMSYAALAASNPFVIPALQLNTTTTKLDAKAGFKGNISSLLSFDTQVNYRIVDSMALFVNEVVMYDTLQQYFSVMYDNVNVLSFLGRLNFTMNEKFKAGAEVAYFNYRMERQKKAWQLPSATGKIMAAYKLGDKMEGILEVFYTGTRFALIRDSSYVSYGLTYFTETERTLKGFTDINLEVKYHYNSKLSAFLKLNNLAGGGYYRWNNYPVQRFNFLLGVSLAF